MSRNYCKLCCLKFTLKHSKPYICKKCNTCPVCGKEITPSNLVVVQSYFVGVCSEECKIEFWKQYEENHKERTKDWDIFVKGKRRRCFVGGSRIRVTEDGTLVNDGDGKLYTFRGYAMPKDFHSITRDLQIIQVFTDFKRYKVWDYNGNTIKYELTTGDRDDMEEDRGFETWKNHREKLEKEYDKFDIDFF